MPPPVTFGNTVQSGAALSRKPNAAPVPQPEARGEAPSNHAHSMPTVENDPPQRRRASSKQNLKRDGTAPPVLPEFRMIFRSITFIFPFTPSTGIPFFVSSSPFCTQFKHCFIALRFSGSFQFSRPSDIHRKALCIHVIFW